MIAGKRYGVEISKDLIPPWGRNCKQRQKEKRTVPAGVREDRLDLYSLCFITSSLELTGLLTVS